MYRTTNADVIRIAKIDMSNWTKLNSHIIADDNVIFVIGSAYRTDMPIVCVCAITGIGKLLSQTETVNNMKTKQNNNNNKNERKKERNERRGGSETVKLWNIGLFIGPIFSSPISA